MAPRLQGLFGVLHRGSLGVMCPACCCGGWPQSLMGCLDRDLIRLAGSGCPPVLGQVSSGRYPRAGILGQVFLDPSVDRSSGSTRGCHHALLPSHPSRFRRRRALRPLPAYGGSPPGASSPPKRCAPSPAFAGAGLVGERTGDDHALLLGQQFDYPGIALGPLAAQHRHCAIDQEPAQIAVAALADRAELDPRLRRGRLLPPAPSWRDSTRACPWLERGPSEAAKCRPLPKACGLTTIAAIALAKACPGAGRGSVHSRGW